MSQLSQTDMRALLEKAKAATASAYVPYSHFPVGAALLLANGNVVNGVNIENASYGLTLCAERVALYKAVSEGHQQFQAIAVWASQKPHGAITPCGACRQVMAEFLSPDIPVIMSDEATGEIRVESVEALLPFQFSRQDVGAIEKY